MIGDNLIKYIDEPERYIIKYSVFFIAVEKLNNKMRK